MCPDGSLSQVGDNWDSCDSLACVGGVSGKCGENNPGGAGFRVTCSGNPRSPAPPLGKSPLLGESPPLGESPLLGCLRAIDGEHTTVSPADSAYTSANNCGNGARSDRHFEPRAVIKVTSAAQVASAVRCAAEANVTVTPRAGAHSFEAEACSGELIVDVRLLEHLSVDTQSKVVEFGSGLLHGQLYHALADRYGLVLPGGTENSVGLGLWLGCGRGILTQVHGLSCDSLRAVEFVDSAGNVRVASPTTDADMFFMARGSGGEFPGIVTKFTAQAYDMPESVIKRTATFPKDRLGKLVDAWSSRIVELSEPSRALSTNVHQVHLGPTLAFTCFSCNAAQLSFFHSRFDAIKNVVGQAEGDSTWTPMSWIDRLCMPHRAQTPDQQTPDSSVTHTFEPCLGQWWRAGTTTTRSTT